MTVFVLVNIHDGFVYGVYDDEQKAYDHGNNLTCSINSWDVYMREVR